MKTQILVDIGIITEYLKTGKGVLPLAYEKYQMMITSLTFAELLASTTFLDSSLETEVNEFLEKYFEVVAVDKSVGLEAAKVLRSNDLTMVSAVNVAAAKVKKMQFLTDDKKQYDKVVGLEFAEI